MRLAYAQTMACDSRRPGRQRPSWASERFSFLSVAVMRTQCH